MSRPLELVSLVVPVYNEEQVLPLLVARLQRILAELPCAAELIFVNDGSRDRSAPVLAQAAAADARFKVIEFSRNFGHQIAITAGTDFAAGDVVVVMDADLQDPPELVGQMIERYQAGYDVVYAQRNVRHGETWFKRTTAAGFYWLMRSAVHKDLPPNTGDFRLMSQPVVHALRKLREEHRFVRGMVTWLGFRQTAILFDRPPRAAGETKYPLRKMLRFAWRAISSFSALPLRMPLALGLVMTIGPAVYAGAAGGCALAGVDAPAWSWLVCLQVALSGVTLLAVGVTGDYIARIYDELKARPLYIVDTLRNFAPERLAALPGRVAVHPGALDLADPQNQHRGQDSLSVRKSAA